MIDRPIGHESLGLESLVLREQIVESCVREREVLDADSAVVAFVEMRHVDDGQSVMLIVIGEEGDEVVAVADIGFQEVGPPSEHLGILRGLENDVGELDR